MNPDSQATIPTSRCEYFTLDSIRCFFALDRMREEAAYDELYGLFRDYQDALGEIQYLIRWSGCGTDYCLARVLSETVVHQKANPSFIRNHSERSYDIFRILIEGWAMRAGRRALSMTQKEVAKELEVSVSTLQRYESLRLRVPHSVSVKFSNLLTLHCMNMEKPVFQALHAKRSA